MESAIGAERPGRPGGGPVGKALSRHHHVMIIRRETDSGTTMGVHKFFTKTSHKIHPLAGNCLAAAILGVYA